VLYYRVVLSTYSSCCGIFAFWLHGFLDLYHSRCHSRCRVACFGLFQDAVQPIFLIAVESHWSREILLLAIRELCRLSVANARLVHAQSEVQRLETMATAVEELAAAAAVAAVAAAVEVVAAAAAATAVAAAAAEVVAAAAAAAAVASAASAVAVAAQAEKLLCESFTGLVAREVVFDAGPLGFGVELTVRSGFEGFVVNKIIPRSQAEGAGVVNGSLLVAVAHNSIASLEIASSEQLASCVQKQSRPMALSFKSPAGVEQEQQQQEQQECVLNSNGQKREEKEQHDDTDAPAYWQRAFEREHEDVLVLQKRLGEMSAMLEVERQKHAATRELLAAATALASD
jgi:hypothetical protein